MISHLELRHIIETAFLPTKCICSIRSDNRMTIQLLDSETHKEQLTVIGVDSSKLVSSHAIATLVGELKEEARIRRLDLCKTRRGIGASVASGGHTADIEQVLSKDFDNTHQSVRGSN